MCVCVFVCDSVCVHGRLFGCCAKLAAIDMTFAICMQIKCSSYTVVAAKFARRAAEREREGERKQAALSPVAGKPQQTHED